MNRRTHLIILAALALCGLLQLRAQVEGGLRTHLEVTQTGTNFSYTIRNDEPASSSFHINLLHLVVSAPIRSISTPAGWDYMTDNSTYVYWFSTDAVPPFANDIAPGESLGGFTVASVVPSSESLAYAVRSWEHGTTNGGPWRTAMTASPSVQDLSPTLSDVFYSTGTKQFRCSVSGIPTLNYSIEVSDDLLNWSGVVTNSAPFAWETSVAESSAAFFRAVYVDRFSLADADGEEE